MQTFPNALSDLLYREIYQSYYRVAGTVSLNYTVNDVYDAAVYLSTIKPPDGLGGMVHWLVKNLPLFRPFNNLTAFGLYGVFAWDNLVVSPQNADSPQISLWLFGGPKNTVILRKKAWQLYQTGVQHPEKVALLGRRRR